MLPVRMEQRRGVGGVTWNDILRDPDIQTATDRGDVSLYYQFALISDELALSLTEGTEYLRGIRNQFTDEKGRESKLEHIRITDLPAYYNREIRKIKSKDLNQFVSVQGIVRSARQTRPRMISAVYKCLRCDGLTTEPQHRFGKRSPGICSSCEKTAGATKFEKVLDKSSYIDSQQITIQERPDDLKAGEQPHSLTAYLEYDLAGLLQPGKAVILNGWLKPVDRTTGKKTADKTTLDYYLDVNSVECIDADFESITINSEDEAVIGELSADPELVERFRRSVAPSIYGMERIKDAMVLQLFSGVSKELPDGNRIRGDIHIFIVGDPGIAKSQLLVYQSGLAPRSVFASGKGSTAAGLTATAVRVNEEWELRAGAMVLADKGIACLDEIDKMRDSDRSNIHFAMEQQHIPINKAGMSVVLPSRCAVLAAANPKEGSFDSFKDYYKQLDIPSTLLSRFDLIFIARDEVTEAEDTAKAEHILGTHMRIDRDKDGMTISPELIRKYVAHARRNVKPVLEEDVREQLRDYYVSARRKYAKGVGVRQLEGLVRLSEASARMHLREKVSVDDVSSAISIFEASMKESATDEYGNVDVSKFRTGITLNKSMRKTQVYSLIQDAGEEGITREQLRDSCTEVTDWEELLEDLRSETKVYEPKNGVYRCTRTN